MREIKVPEDVVRLSKSQLEIAISNNDDILLSFCKNKPPKFGVITLYGLQWNSYQEFQKDAEETCHEYYQLLVAFPKGKVIAPAHADEIFNQKVNPYTLEKLS